MEMMTVPLEALLECCTFTILCKILPRRLLITNTKDSRHEFYFQLFFFVSNLSATINTIMKVKRSTVSLSFLNVAAPKGELHCGIRPYFRCTGSGYKLPLLSVIHHFYSILIYNFSCGCNGQRFCEIAKYNIIFWFCVAFRFQYQ